MAAILAAARNSDTVKALAAGTIAQQKMAAAQDAAAYSDAAAALSAAFDTIKADFLTAHPHLTHAVDHPAAAATPRDAMRAGLAAFTAGRLAKMVTPPADVLARKITPADVAAYPDYFIFGPGHDIADTTACDHGYMLTASCPACP
jgi:hypothetical protein